MIEKDFSIYSNQVHAIHRGFYEDIKSKLDGTKIVCTVGRCKAIEVNEGNKDTGEIFELLNQAERFTSRLNEISNRLFERFYKAKEDFHRSMLMSIAYTKINLIDRNLLERTCDVRWWSLELAFYDCIGAVESFKSNAKPLVDAVNEYHAQWLSDDGRALEIEPLDLIICDDKRDRFLKISKKIAKKNPDIFHGIEFGLDELQKSFTIVSEKISFACTRLEDINSSYTLYRDLVITDYSGHVIASANALRRRQLFGKYVGNESWFQKASHTRSANEYVVEDICDSAIEKEKSLIYATAIRLGGTVEGRVIGAMGIFFDFQGESEIILSDYMEQDDYGETKEGWYSIITDKNGIVLASSDEYFFPVNKIAHLPKGYRCLNHHSQKIGNIEIHGKKSMLAARKTDGYLDYPGLEWVSHVFMPEEEVFQRNTALINEEFDVEQLLRSNLIPKINQEAYELTESTKRKIHYISLNGIISSSKFGKIGASIAPIFNSITQSGEEATSQMEELLIEMATDKLQQNLQALQSLSKQAIDLIDRNLFERAADVRWWATDHMFYEAILHNTREAKEAASNRLKVINQSYTMYRNLVLSDRAGSIIASANDDMLPIVTSVNVGNQHWFRESMKTTRSVEYVVQDVSENPLEPDEQNSLVYAGGVREDGAREGASIGALGILFDWNTEARSMLEACLPKNNEGDNIPGSVALYTNKENEVIETTDAEKFPVGFKIELDDAFDVLKAGESHASIVKLNGHQYIVGATRTNGYREYAGLEWKAYVFRVYSSYSDSYEGSIEPK